LTIEGGIVVMADQKITPPQHHAYIVALNALTRWGNDQKRVALHRQGALLRGDRARRG
jgi:hypothetical protein